MWKIKTCKTSQWSHCNKKNKGFTLLEVLVVVAIIGILSVVILDFFQESYLLQDYIYEQSKAISEAEKGTNNLVKELREAVDSDDGAYALELADEQEVIFYSNIDGDENIERVRYFIDDNQLKKGIIEPTGNPAEYTGDESIQTIASNFTDLGDPIFYYYGEDYPVDDTPLSYPADVTSVTITTITLNVNVDPDSIPNTYTLESAVQIRNFKTNL